MRHGHSGSHPDLLMTIAALLAMGTGLVLFFQFHIGFGAVAVHYAGLSRTVWVNMHRTCCTIFMVLTIHHCAHQKTIVGRLFTRFPRRAGQLYLLLLAGIVSVTGLMAWFALPRDSTSFHGVHHVCIDIHNISALLLLVGLLLHLRTRWKRLFRDLSNATHLKVTAKPDAATIERVFIE